jgi:hypothetical protein
VDELAGKFEEFTLVSYLSTNTITRSAWYLDSGASRHMTEALELFNIQRRTHGSMWSLVMMPSMQ